MLAMHFPGFRVADVEHTDDRVRISISVDGDAATCPDCGRQSTAVHSVYVRQLRDLPILGEPVELQALVRRFRCRNSDCARITFSESLGWLAKRDAQRTDRVTDVLRSLVSMLSTTLSAILASAIGIRTSSSTLLRAVDRSYCLARAPRVLGIDDLAIRRGRTYGTLLCDLETGRPVDILPGRTAEPVAQWISQHPGVEIVARDRATAYAQAVSSAAPGAIQVADRFHLVRNVNDAFREILDGGRWVIPEIAVAPVPEPCTKKPECSTRSELARLAAATRLEDRYEEVWRLFHAGKSIRAIGRATGLCRVTVRKYLQHTEVPRRAPRPQVPGKTTPFMGYLEQRWEAGCHDASQLFKEIRALGYGGSRPLVKAFVQPWRTQVDTRVAPVRRPAWKDVRWAVLYPPERRDRSQQKLAAKCLGANPELEHAHSMVQWFRTILRNRRSEDLEQWAEQASTSQFPSFRRLAKTFTADLDSVHAGVESVWSTGKVEGQITRVKLMK